MVGRRRADDASADDDSLRLGGKFSHFVAP
jgi:hypothetical protein